MPKEPTEQRARKFLFRETLSEVSKLFVIMPFCLLRQIGDHITDKRTNTARVRLSTNPKPLKTPKNETLSTRTPRPRVLRPLQPASVMSALLETPARSMFVNKNIVFSPSLTDGGHLRGRTTKAVVSARELPFPVLNAIRGGCSGFQLQPCRLLDDRADPTPQGRAVARQPRHVP